MNGNDVTGKSQSEIVTELRNVPMGGKVKLVVSRQEDVSKTEARIEFRSISVFVNYEILNKIDHIKPRDILIVINVLLTSMLRK